MKWLLIFAAAVAAVIGGMAVVGALLPKAHVAARTRKFSQPPEAVTAALGDPAATTPGFELVERTPARIVTRVKPGQPYGGTWTWELQPDGKGSALTITERGEVYNPIFRFLSRFVFGHTQTIDDALARLAIKLEEG